MEILTGTRLSSHLINGRARNRKITEGTVQVYEGHILGHTRTILPLLTGIPRGGNSLQEGVISLYLGETSFATQYMTSLPSGIFPNIVHKEENLNQFLH
jgi:hypothetical protein